MHLLAKLSELGNLDWWGRLFTESLSLSITFQHLNNFSTLSVVIWPRENMDVMKKFWASEDLMEHLLPMLDLPSTLALASVNPLVISLVQRTLIWKHLLKTSWQLFLEDFTKVDKMIELLKMMKDPEPFLLDFLEYICRNVPLIGLIIEVGEHRGEIKLQLNGKNKVVGPSLFMLLEHVVASMEAEVMVDMVVEEVQLEYFGGNVGKALTSQAPRQQRKVRKVNFGWGLQFEEGEPTSWEKKDATNCISLLHNCSKWAVKGLYLHSLGQSDWSSLAEASAKGEIKFVDVKREALILGRLEEVKKVWEATTDYWRIIGLTELIGEGGEGRAEGWKRIQKVMEMEDQEWETLSSIKWW